MGQKVHPIGFRLGVIRTWDSRWYASKGFADTLHEDILIRKMINKKLADASVPRIEIERSGNQVSVTIHTARPGIVIGKGGEKVERIRAELSAATGKRVKISIEEVKHPEANAFLVGRSIAEQLQKRVAYKRAIKQAALRTMNLERGGQRSRGFSRGPRDTDYMPPKGIKVIVSGRLGGAEIARTEREVVGKVPLHTLRADIDYACTVAKTTFGIIGIKVWIYKGDVLPQRAVETVS